MADLCSVTGVTTAVGERGSCTNLLWTSPMQHHSRTERDIQLDVKELVLFACTFRTRLSIFVQTPKTCAHHLCVQENRPESVAL